MHYFIYYPELVGQYQSLDFLVEGGIVIANRFNILTQVIGSTIVTLGVYLFGKETSF